MRITPLDIQKHRFRRKLFGLDSTEVRSFLQAVSEQFELVVRDNANYREEIANLREQLRLHEERERVLKDTLVTAQRVAEDMRENARKDAEITVRDGELKAEKLMEVVKGRVSHLQAQIAELKAVRKRIRERVAAMWEEQKDLLDAWAEEDKRDNLEILGPKKVQEAER